MNITHFTRSLKTADYISSYRDAERFAQLCRQCPRYGTTWHCPPYDFDTLDTVSKFSIVHLFATKVDFALSERGLCGNTQKIYGDIMQLVWEQTHPFLIGLEKKFPDSMAFDMACRLCGNEPCTRKSGKPCRHPDQARHSIESFGFDIGLTAKQVFGTELLWSKDGSLPQYLMFITALFTNHDIPQRELIINP